MEQNDIQLKGAQQRSELWQKSWLRRLWCTSFCWVPLRLFSVLKSIILLSDVFNEWHFAKYHSAQSPSHKCHSANCHSSNCYSVKRYYVKCHFPSVILSIVILQLSFSNCHSSNCHSSNCHSSNCLSAKHHSGMWHYDKCHSETWHYANCHSAKCHCADNNWLKCHSAHVTWLSVFLLIVITPTAEYNSAAKCHLPDCHSNGCRGTQNMVSWGNKLKCVSAAANIVFVSPLTYWLRSS